MPLIKKDKHENDLDFAKPYPLTKGFFSLSKHIQYQTDIIWEKYTADRTN